ncbi:transcription termination/antitermination protein NusG [Altererythrobacter sp.]|uniref:transcription termination/antitermination protein NusG n=1 Tax=Altererythrobacter sp. TaxID=1872480 RepID=UPI003D09CD3C
MTSNRQTDLWYLAQIKPNCGQIAQRNLTRQKFKTFLPLERETRTRGTRYVTTTRPYFPGYLFVAFDPDSAPWRAIRSTQGVAGLVCFGQQPAPVPTGIVEELLARAREDGTIRPSLEMSDGDVVRIADGPLVGFVGQVERLAPEQRAWVLLDVMGKKTRVSMPRTDLRMVS